MKDYKLAIDNADGVHTVGNNVQLTSFTSMENQDSPTHAFLWFNNPLEPTNMYSQSAIKPIEQST